MGLRQLGSDTMSKNNKNGHMDSYKRCLGCNDDPMCEERLPLYSKDNRCTKCKRSYEAIKNRRYKKVKDFYHSSAWDECRQEFKRDNYSLCLLCASNGYLKDVDHVHHIISVWTKEGYDKRFDEDNLMCLCEEHHKKVHRGEIEFLYGLDGQVEVFIEDGNEIKLCKSIGDIYERVIGKL